MAVRSRARSAPGGEKVGQSDQNKARLSAIIENVIDGIITIDETGTILSYNPAADRMFGYTASEVLGKNIKMLMPEPYHGEHDSYLSNYIKTGQAKIIGIGREVSARRKDGLEFPIDLAVSEMRVGKHRQFVGSLRDITERKASEKLIKEQSKAIQELSTPVIQVWNGVVLLPLIGNVDARRAQQIIETLLNSIVSLQARVAILDLTGMPVVDTSTAQHLMKTVAAAKMLGAEVIITGIRPEIAQTLIKLDVVLTDVHTHGTLRSGIAAALKTLGLQITAQ